MTSILKNEEFDRLYRLPWPPILPFSLHPSFLPHDQEVPSTSSSWTCPYWTLGWAMWLALTNGMQSEACSRFVWSGWSLLNFCSCRKKTAPSRLRVPEEWEKCKVLQPRSFQVALVVRTCLPMQETKRSGFDPWVGQIPQRRAWQPTPVFSPGESYG